MKLTPLDLIKIEIFNNDTHTVSEGLKDHMKVYIEDVDENTLMSILVFIDEVICEFKSAANMTYRKFKTSLDEFVFNIYSSPNLEYKLLDRVEEKCKQLKCDINEPLDSYYNSQVEYNISKFTGVSCELMDHITILHKAKSNINHILKHVMMRSNILDGKARYNNIDPSEVYDRHDFVLIYAKYLPNIYEILQEEYSKTPNEILEPIKGKSQTIKDDGCDPLENLTDEEYEEYQDAVEHNRLTGDKYRSLVEEGW